VQRDRIAGGEHTNNPLSPVVLFKLTHYPDLLSFGSQAYPRIGLANSKAINRATIMTTRANGTFEVKLTPQPMADTADATLGRMSIEKQFHGDVEGSSKGEMLHAAGSAPGSAGYVAIERVSGTLHGRSGSFVLQHNGTMTRGLPHLTIGVVPDSGTDQLEGLAGTFTIKIADGKHSYEFEYTLAKIP
jgi:uncharacterized protein DUF3224